MIVSISIAGFVTLIVLYESILKQERKSHRQQVDEILKRTESERKELYDRIMSRNISEFKANTEEKSKNNRPRNFLKQQIDSAYRQGGE